MGVTAARKAARVVANMRRILAIELLAACQALEFRSPSRPRRRCGGLRRCGECPAYDRTACCSRDRGRGRAGASGALADAAAVCGTLE